MEVTTKLRRSLRLQNTVFVVLFLAVVALIAGATAIYTYEADWTAGNRNTLSEPSRELLSRAQGPITITAYATDDSQLREQIRRFVGRYQRAEGPEVHLELVNPNARPGKVREHGIKRDGQLVVSYQGRSEKAERRSEQAVSRALQRLMRTGERHVYFLAGHGERPISGQGRSSLSRLTQALEETGAQVDTLNLVEQPEIPEHTALLVLADPQQSLLEPEVDRIRSYLEDGGNLLWLTDQRVPESLRPLAKALGIKLAEQGVAIDPRAQVFGVQDPTQVLISSYPDHPATQRLDSITTFPGATHIQATPPKDWETEPLVQTSARAWVETGSLEGTIAYDEGEDQDGPVTLAVALTREQPGAGGSTESGKPQRQASSSDGSASEDGGKQDGQEAGQASDSSKGQEAEGKQKVIVTSDSDFLANPYLGSGGNRKLGLGIVEWLSLDQDFVTIDPPSAPDQRLSLPPTVAWLLPTVFLGGLPLALLLAGLTVWLRRRRL